MGKWRNINMIDIRTVHINQLSDYDNLLSFIRKSHINSETIKELKNYLGLKCNKIIVEFPYADKRSKSIFNDRCKRLL